MGFVGMMIGVVTACAGGAEGPGIVQAPTAPIDAGAPPSNASISSDAGGSSNAGGSATVGTSAPDASSDPDGWSGGGLGLVGPSAPKLCGCKLCDPIVSDDTCSTDADCAPSLPCHAPRCVAKAHATPRQSGQMCTEIMMCGTADANACGCVKSKCTLHPR